jgi:sporulation protein YlmC with PRC-barrel domain
MRLGQSLIGNPVFRITDGRELGKVKDLYLDNNLKFVVGVFLGSEGLIKRTPTFVRSTDVAVFGMDAVLARSTIVVQEGDRLPGSGEWVRLDDLKGRDVDTPGGTKIGRVGDVVLDEEARVVGFRLTHLSVEGPLAESKAVARGAVADVGHKDGVMTVDLSLAERETLEIDPDSLFPQPGVVEAPQG